MGRGQLPRLADAFVARLARTHGSRVVRQLLVVLRQVDPGGGGEQRVLRLIKNFDGSLDLDSNLRFNMKEFEEVEQSIHEISESEVTSISKLTTVHKYRRPFIALESCETRLSLQSGVGINSLRNPPQDALNSLYRNGQLLREIDDKNVPVQIKRNRGSAFGRHGYMGLYLARTTFCMP